MKENKKIYDAAIDDTFLMQFGNMMARQRQYTYDKKRIDKRTKAYGKPRQHPGIMGKYKAKN